MHYSEFLPDQCASKGSVDQKWSLVKSVEKNTSLLSIELLAGWFFLTVTDHMIELFVQEIGKKREERCSKGKDVA